MVAREQTRRDLLEQVGGVASLERPSEHATRRGEPASVREPDATAGDGAGDMRRVRVERAGRVDIHDSTGEIGVARSDRAAVEDTEHDVESREVEPGDAPRRDLVGV